MTDEVRKTRVFIRNPESGEPWEFCGTLPARDAPPAEWASLALAFGYFATGEIDRDFGGQDGDRFTLEVKRVEMTDDEVKALPEM